MAPVSNYTVDKDDKKEKEKSDRERERVGVEAEAGIGATRRSLSRRCPVQVDATLGTVDKPLLQLIREATQWSCQSQSLQTRLVSSRLDSTHSNSVLRATAECATVQLSNCPTVGLSAWPGVATTCHVTLLTPRTLLCALPHGDTSCSIPSSALRGFHAACLVNFLPFPVLICAAFPVQWRAQWRQARTRVVCWRRFAFRRN